MNLKPARKLRRVSRVKKTHLMDPWDIYESTRLENGFDLAHMAGVFDGKYVGCVAAQGQACSCYGCRHGAQVPGPDAKIVERRTSRGR